RRRAASRRRLAQATCSKVWPQSLRASTGTPRSRTSHRPRASPTCAQKNAAQLCEGAGTGEADRMRGLLIVLLESPPPRTTRSTRLFQQGSIAAGAPLLRSAAVAEELGR